MRPYTKGVEGRPDQTTELATTAVELAPNDGLPRPWMDQGRYAEAAQALPPAKTPCGGADDRLRSCVPKAKLLPLGFAASLAGSSAWADTGNLSYFEGQMPVALDAVTTLGPDLFGDKVNLYNGALQFEQADLSLPGNNSLAVAVHRRYGPGRDPQIRGQLGDWDLALPQISGTFGHFGWVTSSRGVNRCSGYSVPPSYSEPGPGVTVSYNAQDYWQGNMLDVPGYGSQELLQRATDFQLKPEGGADYPLVTRGLWAVTCLNSLKNAPGEGFLAVAPDGTQFRFDWMATRYVPGVRKAGAVTTRTEHFVYASEVIDRFGNRVSYTYDAANPMQLQRIASSDGRIITLQYANGRVSSVNDGTRTFNYVYSASGNLSRVVLPDGSGWTFNLDGMLHPQWEQMGEGAKCTSPGVFQQNDLMGSITHPSGALGIFNAPFRSHGKTFVQQACWYVYGTSGPTSGAVWPILTRSQTLTSKTISGPGIPAQTWTYSYVSSSGWTTCTTCSDKKIVTVTAPDGAVTRHTFGNRWRSTKASCCGWMRAGTARRPCEPPPTTTETPIRPGATRSGSV